MKKLSITFGNEIYFRVVGAGKNYVEISNFADAWSHTDPKQIEHTVAEIKLLYPKAELSVVSHEPMSYTL